VLRDRVGACSLAAASPQWIACPWGVVVHNEEETVFQLVKWVRMPPSMAAAVSVVFLVGGVVGASLAPWTLRENSVLGSSDQMLATHALSHPCGGIIFGNIYRLDGRVDTSVAGRWYVRASCVGTK
jgi:hypothetical protein